MWVPSCFLSPEMQGRQAPSVWWARVWAATVLPLPALLLVVSGEQVLSLVLWPAAYPPSRGTELQPSGWILVALVQEGCSASCWASGTQSSDQQKLPLPANLMGSILKVLWAFLQQLRWKIGGSVCCWPWEPAWFQRWKNDSYIC